MVDIAISMIAGMVGIFVPALLLTLFMKRDFNSFMGWVAIWMFASALFGLMPVWFEFLGIILGGVFVFSKVFVR